jgi:hypothetical protein
MPYQVDCSLDRVLDRLVGFVDDRFHPLADRSQCPFGLPHVALRSSVLSLCLDDRVCSLLRYALDVLHAWTWSGFCESMVQTRLTLWTALVENTLVVDEW